MYTGYLDLNLSNIYNILLATHILHMPRALELCRDFLMQSHPLNHPQHTNVIKPIPSRKAIIPHQQIYPPAAFSHLRKSEETPFKSLKLTDDQAYAKLEIAEASTSKNTFQDNCETKKDEKKGIEKLKLKKRETNEKVIIDIACCDGPVRFHRVINKNYGIVMSALQDYEEVDKTDAMNKAMNENIRDQQIGDENSNVLNSTTLNSNLNTLNTNSKTNTNSKIYLDSNSSSNINLNLNPNSKPNTNFIASSSAILNVRSNSNSNINSSISSNIKSNLNSNTKSSLNSNINSNVNSNLNSSLNLNLNSNINSNLKVNSSLNVNSNSNSTQNSDHFTCLYCNHTFKSQYCYQKHARRHLNPVEIGNKMQKIDNVAAAKREVKLLDMNVQYYPCKTCGSKFPSYYFVHKHRKMCHAEEMADVNNKNNEVIPETQNVNSCDSENSAIDVGNDIDP